MIIAHCIKLTIDEKNSLIAQRQYCLNAINSLGIEAWEVREYSNLVYKYDQRIIEINKHLDYLFTLKLCTIDRS